MEIFYHSYMPTINILIAKKQDELFTTILRNVTFSRLVNYI